MPSDLSLSVFTIIVLILSVIMHEVAHGYAALALGDQTAKRAGRLTLNPVAHIDIYGSIIIPAILVLTNSGFLFGWAKPVPYNPFNLKNQRWGEAIVGAAGVGTNLILAIVFGTITRFAAADGAILFAMLAGIITLVNLSLGFFNLIPFPPLDGYTILRGILPPKYSLTFRDFERRMLSGGFFIVIIGFLLVFNFFLAGPFYSFIQFVFKLLTGQVL